MVTLIWTSLCSISEKILTLAEKFFNEAKRYCIFIIIIFLLFSIWQIKYPISSVDENVVLINSASIINKDFHQIWGASINFFGKSFPLSFCPYHGCIEHYLYLPFIALFGINHISSRIASIFYSILTIIFMFYFLKGFFNTEIAFISSFLLATSLVFILGTRFAILVGSIIPFITMGSLLCLWKWYKNRNVLFFYLGAFLFGIGLNTRIWFVWFLCAVLFASLVFRKELKGTLLLSTKGNVFLKYFLSGPIFIIGVFPMLYYNLTIHFDTVRYCFSKFPITHEGINNTHYLNNLFVRIVNLINLLNGRWLLDSFHFVTRNKISSWSNVLYPFVFLISLLWLGFSILWLKDRFKKKRSFCF
jgi:4-amino-4-deoxy-L-arabinose transferase-like glycosyltransferase